MGMGHAHLSPLKALRLGSDEQPAPAWPARGKGLAPKQPPAMRVCALARASIEAYHVQSNPPFLFLPLP